MDPAMAVEVAAMSGQRALEEATARGDSDIQKFYQNSTVFLTGGSGFMGKQIIEKLLRSCQLSKIFVLLRPKKGTQIQERMNVIFQDPVFHSLRKLQPDFKQKIVAIEGDAAEIKLGISDKDWKTLTDEVEVIYHMAATTRFDESIRLATLINVRGTREAIALGKACKKLKSYVHVSTAYSCAKESLIKQEVYEKFYPCAIPPETLISMAESVEVDRLNGMTVGLIKEWPNTYTFTKAVAEELVRTKTDDLPICIVRPGVVVCAYREPMPGWLDISCAYGATGLILGIGLGVIHVMLTDFEVKTGVVPCDYVNNAIISAGKEATISSGGDSTKIYFVSSNARNTLSYERVTNELHKLCDLVTPKAVYYNYSSVTSNKVIFLLLTWLMHKIPAYLADFVCLLIGKEFRFVKLSNKLYNMSTALSYFTLNDWQFVDDNLEGLYKSLSTTDKTIFNFDLTQIDWSEYMAIWTIGIRKYIIKDGLKNTDYAVRKQFWLRILHYILSSLYLYCMWKFISVVFYIISSILLLLTSQFVHLY